MSSNVTNEDLRSVKTEKALYSALFSLLRKVSFRKITVKAICEESLVCRAAFYSHFIDKYDLLKYCLTKLWTKNYKKSFTFEQTEELINGYISENTRVIKNLVEEADNETLVLLFDFALSTINLTVEKNGDTEEYQRNVVLSNFYAGGMLSYMIWLVNNRFPKDIPPMNKYLYEMIREFRDKTLQ